MKQILYLFFFSPLLVTGLKADLSFTAVFAQSNGFVSPTGSFGVPVTVTNSPTSTEDIVYAAEPFLDFDLLFPDGTRAHNRYYRGSVPSPGDPIDIAPGASLTLFAAFFTPAERFSADSPTPPVGAIFTLSIPDIVATFAGNTMISVAPTGAFTETISSTPEPATWLLLGAVLVAAIARRKKRAFH